MKPNSLTIDSAGLYRVFICRDRGFNVFTSGGSKADAWDNDFNEFLTDEDVVKLGVRVCE